jgi:chorismate dehydratase
MAGGPVDVLACQIDVVAPSCFADRDRDREQREQRPVSERPIRVGGIDYLNALPLTRYLNSGGKPPLEVSSHPPSALAEGLRTGTLDVALAPVVEYPRRDDYQLVPEICISSWGAVESIRLYHRVALKEARVVGLDTSSRSSALLVRLLFRELWGGSPRFVPVAPREARVLPAAQPRHARGSGTVAAGGGDELDAVLLIGDAALNSGEPPVQCRDPGSWSVLDLGCEWTRWTGLPFVYAFWLYRGERVPDGLTERLREAKRVGLARIDDIVREVKPIEGFDEAACRHYLRKSIQYDFGPEQAEGLATFYSLLERNGLVATPPRALAV